MKQEAENFIEGLYEEQESNTRRKTDCSKSNMSRYFVTVFFSTEKKIYSPVKVCYYLNGRKVYNYHIIVTVKIDSVEITSVRKAGLTIYESL